MFITIMLLTILIPIKVKADNYDMQPEDAYMNYETAGQKQVQTFRTNQYGMLWYTNTVPADVPNQDRIIKGAYLYDMRNKNYDYFSIMIRTIAQNNNIAVTYDSINCELVNSGTINQNQQQEVVYAFICKNTKKQDFINIFIPQGWGRQLSISSYIAFYNDISSARIDTTIQVQTQQENQNWNNFNQQDISQQDQTQPDTSGITNVQQQETQQINSIEQALQNLQAPTFDLTDFRATFGWIWQTIMYLFTTHTILLTTMTIILSLGFIKTIFGR